MGYLLFRFPDLQGPQDAGYQDPTVGYDRGVAGGVGGETGTDTGMGT